MKKYLLLLPVVAVLGTGCKKDGDEPVVPEFRKLVDTITYVAYDEKGKEREGTTRSFTYDALNRVTKMVQEYAEFDSSYGLKDSVTFSYSGNQVTSVETYHDNDEESTYEIITSVLTLDANGRVVSGTERIEFFIDDKPHGDIGTGSWTATYDSEGQVTKALKDNGDASVDFTWSGGNLTKQTDSDGNRPAPWYVDYKCGTQSNNPVCNVDMNQLTSGDSELTAFALLPQTAAVFGFYGKTSDKLVTEAVETDGTAERKFSYTWELSADGFVKKMTATQISGEVSYKTVYTVTYKN